MRRLARLMRNRLRDEQGITLIELVVASGLSLLVLGIIASMMVSGFSAQGRISTTNEATSYAQLAAKQLETGFRQASYIEVFYGENNQLVVARTETGSGTHGTWQCQAWFYDDTAGAIFHTTYEGDNIWPWGSDLTNWIDLGSGLLEVVDVGAVLGDTLDWLFGGDDDGEAEWSIVATGIRNETGTDGAEAPVFSQSGNKGVAISFAFHAEELPPVLIATTVTGRQAFADSSPTCSPD